VKTFEKIWLILSFALLLITAFGIINTYVSVKYEIEVYNGSLVSEALKEKKQFFEETLVHLWAFFIYLLINLVFLLRRQMS
jgi:hypothetical protein